MSRSIFSALLIVLTLTVSGCASYHTPGGKAYADPKFCSGGDGSALCMLGVGAIVFGAAALAVKN